MATTNTPAASTGYAYCSWHQAYASGTRLVRQPPDQGSGPAVPGLFACLPCREMYDLVPLEDQ